MLALSGLARAGLTLAGGGAACAGREDAGTEPGGLPLALPDTDPAETDPVDGPGDLSAAFSGDGPLGAFEAAAPLGALLVRALPPLAAAAALAAALGALAAAGFAAGSWEVAPWEVARAVARAACGAVFGEARGLALSGLEGAPPAGG